MRLSSRFLVFLLSTIQLSSGLSTTQLLSGLIAVMPEDSLETSLESSAESSAEASTEPTIPTSSPSPEPTAFPTLARKKLPLGHSCQLSTDCLSEICRSGYCANSTTILGCAKLRSDSLPGIFGECVLCKDDWYMKGSDLGDVVPSGECAPCPAGLIKRETSYGRAESAEDCYKCEDDPYYEDPFGQPCKAWATGCNSSTPAFRQLRVGEATKLQKRCLVSCGVCTPPAPTPPTPPTTAPPTYRSPTYSWDADDTSSGSSSGSRGEHVSTGEILVIALASAFALTAIIICCATKITRPRRPSSVEPSSYGRDGQYQPPPYQQV